MFCFFVFVLIIFHNVYIYLIYFFNAVFVLSSILSRDKACDCYYNLLFETISYQSPLSCHTLLSILFFN